MYRIMLSSWNRAGARLSLLLSSTLPLALFLTLSMPAHALAQAQPRNAPVDVLSLQQAIDLALAASPDLAAARHESDAVAATIAQAGLLPNPSLSVGVEDTRRQTRTSTLEISQPIELGGKRGARVAAANRAHAVAQAELLGRQADVRAHVVTAFLAVLHAQERLQLAQDTLVTVQRGSGATARRVKAGKVSPVEQTRAHIAELDAQLDADQAAGELALARRSLAAIWGNSGKDSGEDEQPHFARVAGDRATLLALPELPALAALHARLPASPTMQRAEAEVRYRQALAELEQRKRSPDIALNVGVQRDAEVGRNKALLGVSIPLPLFDRNQGNLREALRRTDKARSERQAASLRLVRELTQAHEQLRLARMQARTLAHELLPAAQGAHDATIQGFAFGKFDFLDVLDAQRTLLAARARHLRALLDAHLARAEIERLLGVPLSDSPLTAPRDIDATTHHKG